MGIRYSYLKLQNFTAEKKQLARSVGLEDYLKSAEGKMILTEFHKEVKSADGSGNDEQFMRALQLAEETFQYRTLECVSIDGLAPEQRERYIHVYNFVESLVRGEGGNRPMPTEDAMEIVTFAVLDNLRRSGLSPE